MISGHILAFSLALVIDQITGDPPSLPHPVRWFGNMISFLEKRLNKGRNRKQKGLSMAIIVIITVFSLSFAVTYYAYSVHYWAGIVLEAVLISTTVARKDLIRAALEVYRPLIEGNMTEARKKLSCIVGRDTERLDEREIVRGTVETVAENTCDAVTAPLFWAFIGGAPLALVYRAVNTCDSMVGYQNSRYHEFGYFSAKADDVLNWIPARITGFLMLIANRPRKMRRGDAWRILLRDAKKHPSPNSGWCEAACACLLSVQLGGRNTYNGIVSERARMGEPFRELEHTDILRANRILTRTVFAFLLLLWLGGVLLEIAVPWSQSPLFV